MTVTRTAFSISLAVKRLSRRKRRDQVLQALQQIVAAKGAARPAVGVQLGVRLGATTHELHKALPDLQHAQIGRELEKACRQLSVEVVNQKFRGRQRIRFWDLSKCRVCGCDELHACRGADGPCSWASLNLCSRCAP